MNNNHHPKEKTHGICSVLSPLLLCLAFFSSLFFFSISVFFMHPSTSLSLFHPLPPLHPHTRGGFRWQFNAGAEVAAVVRGGRHIVTFNRILPTSSYFYQAAILISVDDVIRRGTGQVKGCPRLHTCQGGDSSSSSRQGVSFAILFSLLHFYMKKDDLSSQI